MLCSDGLYHYFTTKEMEKILDMEPQAACEALVNEANRQGSDDNVTVQVVKSNIGARFKLPGNGERKMKWRYIGLSSFVVLLIAFFSLWMAISDYRQKHKPKAVERDSVVTGSEKKIPSTTSKDSVSEASVEEQDLTKPAVPKQEREGTDGE